MQRREVLTGLVAFDRLRPDAGARPGRAGHHLTQTIKQLTETHVHGQVDVAETVHSLTLAVADYLQNPPPPATSAHPPPKPPRHTHPGAAAFPTRPTPNRVQQPTPGATDHAWTARASTETPTVDTARRHTR